MTGTDLSLPTYMKLAHAKIAAFARPMTVSEIEALGINRMTLSQLASEGLIERPVRGVYHVPGSDDDQRVFWAAISLGYDAVFCLRAAASYHSLTEEGVGHPDIAIPLRARIPAVNSFEIRVKVHRWPDLARTLDVDVVDIQGVRVRITSPARTVIDLFRHSEMNDDPAFKPVVDAVTFLDCLNRYLERSDTSELRRIAKDHQCWDHIKRLSTAVKHTASSAVPR